MKCLTYIEVLIGDDVSFTVGETAIMTATLRYADGTGKKVFKSAAKAKALAAVKWSKVPKPDVSKIKSVDLITQIEMNYKSTSVTGNGSTADAIRYTKATGDLVGNFKPSDHVKKGQDKLFALQKRFNANDLNEYDKKIATDIFNDITNALNGK